MSFVNGLPANFTISEAAKQAIADIKELYRRDFPNDPPMVAQVAWAIFKMRSGESFERPLVGFYQLSEFDDVRHGIEVVSGVELIFFITEQDYDRFAGKVLDWSQERVFFLRDPVPGE